MYNYFPHPSNARSSSMLVSLLIEEGYEGYGLYWAILEILRDAPAYRYSSDPRVWLYVLHAHDQAKIERILQNYGLFEIDGDGLLFSPWLLEQLCSYDDSKKRRQEAGRKGAASRWGGHRGTNGNAIAMPLGDNGNAIAYNNIQPKSIEPNISQSTIKGEADWRDICLNQGDRISDELLQALSTTSPEGHVPAYIAQICRQYGMGENVLNLLCELTNNADITSGTYKKFVAIVKRIEVEKFHPKLPANYILSKLQSNQ